VQRQMLKSKIHRAAVTGCDPDYVGSNGAAALLVREGDKVTGAYDEADLDSGNLIHEGSYR
jgi:aspartate 1-decarboxylase